MKLFFYGAAREVTGSCYCLDVNGKKLLVDCGLQQGKDEKDDQMLPFDSNNINYVVLTHAHIDHSGRLPLLVKNGFKGKIYATKATCDLISIMLRDSAHIQEMDAKWENNRGRRSGKDEVKPLYSMADAENVLKFLVPCNYSAVEKICDGVDIKFVDAGHILGSASVEMFLTEGETSKKIVFSGDIGNTNQPIINDPQYIKEADYVVMESTYGNKNHEKSEDHTLDFAKIIDLTLRKGGNVIIPSFAVGRTQDLLYFIREIKEKKLVTSNPNFPVYVDSPLATDATQIYDDNLMGYADPESRVIMNRGNDPLIFPNLHFTDSTDESKALNFDDTPKVIISSSGMCDAGRIRQHLKHNLWRRECSVIFVGFQANGTLGRILLDGARKVKIFGEEIAVLATIHSFSGLSAHADKDGLLKWVGSFTKKPSKVFVTHGEDLVCEEFVDTISELGFLAVAPLYKSNYDLGTGEEIEAGIEIEKKVFSIEKAKAVSVAYANLLSANSRLLEAINHNKGGANKDLEKFANEILKMVDKWDR